MTPLPILHASLQLIDFRCFPEDSFREMKREAGASFRIRDDNPGAAPATVNEYF
jgi:hypothetical protein